MPEGEEQEAAAEEQESQPEPQVPDDQYVPRDALPEELRGQDPETISRTLDTMTQVLRTRNEENQELRQRLNALEEQARRPEPQEEDLSDEELKELIYENPEEAIDKVIRKRYGSVMQSVNRANEGVAFMQARDQFGEKFEAVEDDVRTVLEQSGAAPTPENVEWAFYMAHGRRSLTQSEQEARQERKEASAPERPSPPEQESEPQLTDLEDEIRRGMNMSKEEYVEYRDAEELVMDVPTGEA